MAQETIGANSSTDEVEPSKVSWAHIVKASRNQMNMKLDFYEPLVVNGKLVVAPLEEVRMEGIIYWKNCLVGHFVGNRPAFLVVSSIAKKLWSKEGL